MPSSFPALTDGPDRLKGSLKCRDHHTGTRTGLTDWCCCCDPCNYQRFKDFSTAFVAPRPITNACCRCVPQAICLSFMPDVGADPCCRGFNLIAFPVYANSTNDDSTITYSFTFTTVGAVHRYDLAIIYHYAEYPGDASCTWDLTLTEIVGPTETVLSTDSWLIDHVNTTCLTPPDIIIEGEADSTGCSGTLGFSPYQGSKVPFHNRNIEDKWDLIGREVAVPYPACNCQSVVRVLCVAGVRHTGGDFETVEFAWREDMGDQADRWEYLPPGGNPSTDREVIYLRGDYEGNCWLELDFEQSGSDTNDWGEPPNTFDEYNPTEIREGMIQIPTCGSCGFLVKSERSDGRYVTITSGYCGRWEYACEKCRCVPTTLCVVGVINQEAVNLSVTWDDVFGGWSGDAGGYIGNIRLNIKKNDIGECVLGIEGADNPDVATLNDSEVSIRCDLFLTTELYSGYDSENPDNFSWLFISGGFCGCVPQLCGICLTERCGGPPQTLYATMMARQPGMVEPPSAPGPDCNVTIALHRWERWILDGGVPGLRCGYIGFYQYECDGNVFRITFQILFGHNISIIKEVVSGTNPKADRDTANFALWNGVVVEPYGDCDPVYFEIDWQGASSAVGEKNCPWGCVDPGAAGLMDIRLEIQE